MKHKKRVGFLYREPRRTDGEENSTATDSPSITEGGDQKRPNTGTVADAGEYEVTINRIIRFANASEIQPRTSDKHAPAIPRLGSLKEYGAGSEHATSLWKLEANRLLHAAHNLSPGALQPEYGVQQLTGEGLVELGVLAETILCALHICSASDELMLMDFDRALVKLERLSQSFDVLQTLTGAEFDLPGYTKANRPQKPRRSRSIGVTNYRQYYKLVDFLTGALALVAVGSVAIPYWRIVVLSTLTKLSTKLKVLGRGGLAKAAIKCGESIRKQGGPDWYREARTSPEGFPEYTDVPRRHCIEHAVVSRWLCDSLEAVLTDLGAHLPSYMADDKLDICAVIFRAGIAATPTFIHQDSQGNIAGLVETTPLAFTRRAMHLAMDLGLKIRSNANQPPPLPGAWRGTLSCFWEQDGSLPEQTQPILLTTSAALITVITPLALVKPSVARLFYDALRVLSTLPTMKELEVPATNFTAKITLHLRPSNTKREPILSDIGLKNQSTIQSVQPSDKDSVSLSDSLIAKNRLCLLEQPHDQLGELSGPEQQRAAMARKLGRIRLATTDWEIDETSVTVRCPEYSWSILIFCGILVAGGLAGAFTIGDRIEGVDPFNIASFTWLCAGFIVLVSKASRVSDWPWHDFFRGRVRCRSVKELRTASGLEGQEVLFYLLSSQKDNPLTTKGPFNKPFRRRDREGFSIDIPVELETLMASGIVLLKVTGVYAPALILLDLIPGPDTAESLVLTAATHSMGTEQMDYRGLYTKELACCLDIQSWEDKDARLARVSHFSWRKIVGLYNRKGRKFK
ncbi:hypothetical protein MMYC01_210649 [Madurella mycetomatis]|uniref:Uncharacterized protein n=1 Tax=Madurella mycetomatis TaxID=100816 RepID=A0A175VN52_9PEZI|nr:hypothetical protein MMYC01_210649 [Madurella mycetomatis]